jgi:hypothetical protein
MLGKSSVDVPEKRPTSPELSEPFVTSALPTVPAAISGFG